MIKQAIELTEQIEELVRGLEEEQTDYHPHDAVSGIIDIQIKKLKQASDLIHASINLRS